MNDYINHTTFNSVGEIVSCLLSHSKIPHKEYESVKLYGESYYVIEILKYIIRHNKKIEISSLDVTHSYVDCIEPDLYVLIITDSNELYIQPAYNGNILFANEAKFTICQNNVGENVVLNASKDNTPVIIGNFIF